MSWRRSCPPPSLTTSFWIPITDPMIPNFLKFIFNWRIIALQCCVGFCYKQCQSAISIHMFPPSWTSLPLPTPSTSLGRPEHWIELPVLYSSFPLASYLTCDLHTYVSTLLSTLSISLSSPLVCHVWVCSAKQTGRRMFGQWAPLLGRLKASQEDVARGWLVGPLNSYIFLYLKNPGSSEVHTNLRI